MTLKKPATKCPFASKFRNTMSDIELYYIQQSRTYDVPDDRQSNMLYRETAETC